MDLKSLHRKDLGGGWVVWDDMLCVASRKDLGVGGWGLENSYGVRILNPLEIIGRPLMTPG